MAIAAAAAGGGAALLILIIIILIIRRRKANGTKTAVVLGPSSLDPFEIPRNSLSMGAALGDGHYGRVRQASLSVCGGGGEVL